MYTFLKQKVNNTSVLIALTAERTAEKRFSCAVVVPETEVVCSIGE